MMNKEMMNGTAVNVAEAQESARDLEMDLLLVYINSLTLLDEEEDRRSAVYDFCEIAIREGARVPDYSDDMIKSFNLATMAIDVLLNTNEEVFYDIGVVLERRLISDKCMNEDDRKMIEKTAQYIMDIFDKRGIEDVKKLLRNIKLYLSATYYFIKERHTEQH